MAKHVGGGMAVVWLFSTVAAILYLPVAVGVMIIQAPVITSEMFLSLAGSVVLHTLYYFLLQRGYRAGDLTLVYPLARGTGPALAAIGAILLLGERPSVSAMIGAALISVAVFIFASSSRTISAAPGQNNRAAVIYGLLCGLSIAAYTIWDKQAVSALFIPPILLTWFGNAAQAVILAPAAARSRDAVRTAWQNHRRAVIGIGILDSLGYILFLIALSVSSVSVLAPLRQTSILIGAYLGVRLLSEAGSRRRYVATGIMLVGLIALTFG